MLPFLELWTWVKFDFDSETGSVRVSHRSESDSQQAALKAVSPGCLQATFALFDWEDCLMLESLMSLKAEILTDGQYAWDHALPPN